jgi:hypothetical protein
MRAEHKSKRLSYDLNYQKQLILQKTNLKIRSFSKESLLEDSGQGDLRVKISLHRGPILKGKAQHSWPPH